MISKRVESWAWSTNIFRARGNPFVLPRDIDKLILVECSEREAGWSGLSFFFGVVIRGKMTIE